jgi:hypothetical protein
VVSKQVLKVFAIEFKHGEGTLEYFQFGSTDLGCKRETMGKASK